MPKDKRRRKAVSCDGDAIGTKENPVNGSGSIDGTNYRVSAINERERDNGNDHVPDQVNGARPRQSKASRENRQSSLGPWTQAVREVIQSMGVTHRAINDLEDRFKSYMDDLLDVDETKNTLIELKGECSEKDNQIKVLESTIDTLRSMDSKEKAHIDQNWAEIQTKTAELKEEKLKQDKRNAAITAEDRLKLQNDFEERTTKHDRDHRERTKKLQDEFARGKEDMHRTVSDLKTENQKLVATVEEQENSIKVLSKKLEDVLKECDAWKRATDSVKQEKQEVDKKLQMIREEFALDSRPSGYLYASRLRENLVEELSY